jgi:hypothetical protein
MALRTTSMDTAPVDRATAAAIEGAEARAWADLYAAAPADFAAAAGVGTRDVGGALVTSWAATGRRYFSRAIGLGVLAPATPEAVDDIIAGYRAAGITMFLLPSQPHCRPAGYERWLAQRGLEPFDAHDRIVRGGEPLAGSTWTSGDRDLVVEEVGPERGDEWAELLQRDYRLEAGPWLAALLGRPGWHQYVVREGGAVVAARGMYIGPDGIAWLGMDGPVPGLRTHDHGPDAALCAAIVAAGLARGARGFIADIEAPSPTLDTPAYDHFGRLGFRRPYAARTGPASDAPSARGARPRCAPKISPQPARGARTGPSSDPWLRPQRTCRRRRGQSRNSTTSATGARSGARCSWRGRPRCSSPTGVSSAWMPSAARPAGASSRCSVRQYPASPRTWAPTSTM